MRKQTQELLQELVSARSHLMSQLADEAEEAGEESVAKAWRWLRDNRKWPTPRSTRHDKAFTKSAWGWVLTASSLRKAKIYSSSSLPKILVDEKLMKHGIYESEESALFAAVKGLSEYFARI